MRGPQLALPGRLLRVTKANGQPHRTARIRFVEPPASRKGNPFFALRVDAELLDAFRAHARKAKVSPNDLVKAYMSKVTGVEVGEDDAQD